jgi:CBS domain-containing protein
MVNGRVVTNGQFGQVPKPDQYGSTPNPANAALKAMASDPSNFGGGPGVSRGTLLAMSGTFHATVGDVADLPVAEVVTVRGKELAADATVAAGRALFGSSSVQLVPVIDGDRYAGAVTRDDLADARDDEPIAALAHDGPPTTTASTPVRDALAALGPDDGLRLVVLGDDGSTYVGLLCLHRDRERLCIDAECHVAAQLRT